MSRCTCSGCGARFVGAGAFDTHRVGAFSSSGRGGRTSTRRCLTTPAELLAAGLVLRPSKAKRADVLNVGLSLWGLAADTGEREIVAGMTGAPLWPQFEASVPVPEVVTTQG